MPATSKKRQATEQHPAPPAAKRPRSSYSDLISILAGSDEIPSVVHKESLRKQSDFFTAACKRDCKEGAEKTIRVPTIEPDALELYIYWVYKGALDLSLVPLESPRADEYRWDHPDCMAEDIQYLIQLYVAGDMFLNHYVQNEVINELSAVFAPVLPTVWAYGPATSNTSGPDRHPATIFVPCVSTLSLQE
ncbi:hypothetical protein LTR29_016935 [Friedmanniomyces endolithicus]|nr:hypothetical protein LTR29_016935 [Friedmanniomyces endolithicus]